MTDEALLLAMMETSSSHGNQTFEVQHTAEVRNAYPDLVAHTTN
jgi:hypothetical protein